MLWHWLALLLVLAQADARWTAALMLANGTTLTARDNSLFRSDSAVTVYGAEGIIDLDYYENTLLAVVSTCVLSISNNMAGVYAGSVYESGQRYGPPLYARFSRLIALALVSDSIVLIDADRADGSIIIIDDQAARPLAIVPQSFALSGFHEFVLVIAPAAAHILQIHDGSVSHSILGAWVAGLLLGPSRALLSLGADIWQWSNGALQLQPQSQASASKLMLVDGVAWGASYSSQAFFIVARPDLGFPVIDTWSTRPANGACPPGYVLLWAAVCVQASPGGYAIDGVFFTCPAGTHNDLPQATTIAACKKCPPFTRASPVVCVHCGLLASDGISCVASCPTKVAGLCDEAETAPICYPEIIVATVARSGGIIAATRSNGTLYAARGSRLSVITATEHTTTIELTDSIGCMTLSPDESTLYLGGAILRRCTNTAKVITIMTNSMPSDALCASDSAVFVLYRGVVSQILGEVLTLPNVLHIAWDGALVALLRLSDSLLQIVREGVALRNITSPAGSWIARWPGSQTVMAIDYGLALWPDAQEDTQWLAGSQQQAGTIDDIGDRARFGLLMGGQPLGPHALLVWDDQFTRVLFKRGCECPADHYKTTGGCTACPALTYAMAGASMCTACSRGSYMDGYGVCQPCPSWWWGDSPTPCTRLRDTLPSDPHLTFAELSADDPAVDFTLSVFVIGQPPRRDALPATDYLGRLWTSVRAPRPAGQTQCVPGLWALCSQPTGDDCVCWYTIPLTMKQAWLSNGAGIKGLFARRGDTLVSVGPGGNSTVLPASSSLHCYIGWPYQCACGDPSLYWSFSKSGCVQCPPNTAVPPNLTECAPISPTNPLCYEGHFLSSTLTCLHCAADAFSNTKNAPACTPKRVLACKAGEYLIVSDTSDNVCAACIPCAESEITFGEPCSGSHTHPTYVCTPWAQNIPGFSVIISEWPTLSFVPCPLPKPAHSQWASGPQFGLCYFSCMYSVGDTQEYALDTGTLPWPSTPNLFPLALSVAEICLPCETAPCPEHTWRPLWTSECGAPCLLVAERYCPNNASGCVSLCTIPANSHYTAPENCEWACDVGWFIRNGGCHVCQAASCELGELYDAYACFNGDPKCCTPCPQPSLAAVKPGFCRLDCPPGLFQRAMSCEPCVKGHYCPPGYRAVCAETPCAPCTELPDNSIFAASNDDACRVNCKAGFQTIDILSNDIAPYEESHNATMVKCEECGLRAESLFCPLLSCPVGEAIVTVASADGSSLRCMPCQSSVRLGCAAGTYAMSPCPGGVATQSHCLICPLLPENQMHIPYSASGVATCPSACIEDYVMRPEGCVACTVLYSRTPVFHSYFARWNAPAAARWWPEALDPPHLGLRLAHNEPEPRAGKCWPCGSNNDPLCPKENSIVTLPVIQDSLVLVLARYRRLLLSVGACPLGSYPRKGGGCALCPPQRFCAGGPPQRCGRFAVSEVGASACRCRDGFVHVNGHCMKEHRELSHAALALTCSPNEHRYMQPTGAPACIECPRGTCPPLCVSMPPFASDCDGGCLFGSLASGGCLEPQCPWLPSEARCACGPGSQPQSAGCIPCPVGTFSAHIGDAPCTPCPANTTALEGATRLADCF